MGLTTWTRRYHFQSVHALRAGAHTESLHGHHYSVEVTLKSAGSPARSAVDQVVEEEIVSHLHAREIAGEIDPATGEVLVDWIHERLKRTMLGPSLLAVALQETRKNRFVSSMTEARFV